VDISLRRNRNTIEYYVTIASTGNAVDFGDLTVAIQLAMASIITNKRSFCWWIRCSRGKFKCLDYVNFQQGNAVDFGDLTGVLCRWCTQGASSNAHGGL
jgi:hypothetical protein